MTYKEIKGNQCWSKGGGGGIKQVIKCHKRSTEHYNWGTSVFYCRGATDQYGLPLDFCLRGPPPIQIILGQWIYSREVQGIVTKVHLCCTWGEPWPIRGVILANISQSDPPPLHPTPSDITVPRHGRTQQWFQGMTLLDQGRVNNQKGRSIAILF